MSTDIDGQAPSMSDADPAGSSATTADPDGSDASQGAADVAPDASSVRMRRELKRRAARIRTLGGRHASNDVDSRALPADYVPRHALSTPGPAAAVPDPVAFTPATEPTTPRKRERVVLSERRRAVRPVRTVVDVQELTGVGDVLSTNLIRSQLGLALRVAGVAVFTLALVPALFAVFPVLGRVEVLNIRLPWLLLGALVYPFLLGLGWLHAKSAERLEQSFTEHVRD